MSINSQKRVSQTSGSDRSVPGEQAGPITERVLAFDVGGTTIRAGVYNPEADSLEQTVRHPTPSAWVSPELDPSQLFGCLLSELRSVGDGLCAHPTMVSVAFPGPIDAMGRVLAIPTVTGGKVPLPLGEILARVWPDARVYALNDVTAAGLTFARDDCGSYCIFTVGSGIGNKLFVEGCPVVGAAGRGGEVGHLRVDHRPEANRCECGERGHLGAIASGRGTLMTARALSRAQRGPDFASAEDVVAGFRVGERFARKAVREGAEHLARQMAAMHTMAGVERFPVTGGFAAALGEPYRQMLVDAAAAACWDLGQDWDSMIELDAAPETSGLLGAGRFASLLQPSAVQ
jgi:glucokinase